MCHERRAMLTLNHRVAREPQNRCAIPATPHPRLALVILCATCVFLVGLAVLAQESRPMSGFLGDYSKLVPDAKNGDLLVYEKDPNVLKKYNKFIFDPITIYLLPEARDRGIDPDDLERLAQYFHDAVTDELKKSGRYEIVTTPGPDVLELNVAITNVEPTGGKKNAAVKGGAAAVSAATVPGIGLAVPRLSVGRVSIEGEMLGFKKWADIEAAFRSWAKNFRERLDEAHGS
jgi:hypothetical protein